MGRFYKMQNKVLDDIRTRLKDGLKTIQWTHYHIPSFGEHCIVLQTRGGFLGFLGGTHRVLLEDGYVGWTRKRDIGEIGEIV